MIESDNLRTASLYINNQLLSRGLLRDGQNIDFASPGGTDEELASMMGRVMSVVNDLILRRDRDAEHRENLSTTIRTLRAESLRQTADILALRDRHADAQRKASLAEAAETAARAQLKAAEASIHKLRDEAAKTKVLVAQTRAACANETRKRDRQIDGLKKAVADAGRARGAGKNPGITTIHVVGEVGGDGSDKGAPSGGTAGESYDLRMETNGFLAELAKGLSEENEALLVTLRRTNSGLREMSGWDKEDAASAAASQHAVALPANPEELSVEIDSVVSHLRNILTNPSFVPIEEVVVREEEISRLRDGWEKMESRWLEAVHLIDGWRRRMQVDGRPVNMEELKMGLRLSPVRVKDVAETAMGLGLRLEAVIEEVEEQSNLHSPNPAESLHLVPAPEFEDPDDSDSASSIFADDVDVEELDVEEPNVQILQQSAMLSSPPLPTPPQLSPLKDSYTAGNRGTTTQTKKTHAGIFTTILEENTKGSTTEVSRPPPRFVRAQGADKKSQPAKPLAQDPISPTSVDLSTSNSSLDSVLLIKPAEKTTSKASASSAKPSSNLAPKSRIRPDVKAAPRPSVKPTTKSLEKQPSRPTAQRGRQRVQPSSEQVSTRTTEQPTSSTTSQTTTTSTIDNDADESTPVPELPPTHTSAAKSAPRDQSPRRVTLQPSPSKSSLTSTAAATTADKSIDRAPPAPALPPTPQPASTSVPTARDPSPRRVNSRLPLPRTAALLPPPQQSPLTMATIAAKLAASERDADAARVRAKLRAARLGKRASLAPPVLAPPIMEARSTRSDEGAAEMGQPEAVADGGEDAGAAVVVVVEEEKPRKREKRASKVASRRRSTLNPWELESLIQGNVNVVPSPER